MSNASEAKNRMNVKYFVMKSDYSWAEVTKEVYDTAGTDPNLITNTATLNSENFVDITVRNIGLAELAELFRIHLEFLL